MGQGPKVRVRTGGVRTQTQARGSRLSIGSLAKLPRDPGSIRAPPPPHLRPTPPAPFFPHREPGTGSFPPRILGQTDELHALLTLCPPPYMASKQASLEAF